jgi:hypothetical protein
MTGSTHSAFRDSIPMRELKWSQEEKAAARRAYDLALGRELEAVVREAKERAARLKTPGELWDLEEWLTKRRREIDNLYDYRYSVLPLVLAALLYRGLVSEAELEGLGRDKLDRIRLAAGLGRVGA